MPIEGFPDDARADLRFYLDGDGRFTPRLREHYAARAVAPEEAHAVFVKAGSSWMETPYDCLTAGMVVRVMERATKHFVVWQDTGTTEVLLMRVARIGKTWGIQVRRPTEQEFADA